MSVFGPSYATIFDAIYHDYNFSQDVRAFTNLTREFLPGLKKPKLLDLGCGTGTHLKLLQDEFEVEGVDLSEEMLKVARTKVSVPLSQGDARTFNLDRQFDVILMTSAVLGYQHSNDHVLETLRNVRKHLKPGGLFIFDVWYGPAVLSVRPSTRVKEVEASGVRVVRMVKPRLVLEKNLCTCDYRWWLTKDGLFEEKTESHTLRYFFPLEIDLFLQNAGMQLLRYGQNGHDYRPVEDDHWHVMFVVRG